MHARVAMVQPRCYNVLTIHEYIPRYGCSCGHVLSVSTISASFRIRRSFSYHVAKLDSSHVLNLI